MVMEYQEILVSATKILETLAVPNIWTVLVVVITVQPIAQLASAPATDLQWLLVSVLGASQLLQGTIKVTRSIGLPLATD